MAATASMAAFACVMVAGCGVPPATDDLTPNPSLGSTASASVTTPGMTAFSTGAAPSGTSRVTVTVPDLTGFPGTVATTGSGMAGVDGGELGADGSTGGTAPVTGSGTGSTGASMASPGSTGSPGSPGSPTGAASSDTRTTVPPNGGAGGGAGGGSGDGSGGGEASHAGGVTSTAASTTSPGTIVNGVMVDLSDCSTCTSALAGAASVRGSLSAVLTRSSGGATLLSVNKDGTVVGTQRVSYGSTFAAPAGGRLPCDSAGRCVVVGTQSNGDAILSAFQLSADGSWRDRSNTAGTGFPSSTSRGGVVDLGGGALGLAVQVSGGGKTGWMVLGWTGDRYTVVGCAPDSPSVPAAGALSEAACLS